MQTKSRKTIVGCLCALTCEIFYGLSYVFTRQATETADALSLLGWRFMLAFVIMSVLVLCGVVKIHLKGKKIGALFIIALFDPAIYFTAETLGISMTSACESGVLLACIPVASLAMSAWLLRKKPTRMQVTGILVTLIGVLFTVFAASSTIAFSWMGYAILLVAVLSYALYSVFVEKATEYTGAEITYVMLGVGAAVFGIGAIVRSAASGSITSLLSLPFTNGAFLTAILYQGIGCSVLAFFMSIVAIENIGVNRTSSFIGASTVVSILAGTLLLREAFSLTQGIGAAVIVAGIYIANITKEP